MDFWLLSNWKFGGLTCHFILIACLNSAKHRRCYTKWLSDRKFVAVNIISSSALWGLWKLRNELCFQNVGWRNMNLLIWRIGKLAQNWSILCPPTKETELRTYISSLKDILRRPVMLTGAAWKKTQPASCLEDLGEKQLTSMSWSVQLKELDSALTA